MIILKSRKNHTVTLSYQNRLRMLLFPCISGLFRPHRTQLCRMFCHQIALQGKCPEDINNNGQPFRLSGPFYHFQNLNIHLFLPQSNCLIHSDRTFLPARPVFFSHPGAPQVPSYLNRPWLRYLHRLLPDHPACTGM